MSSDPDIEEVEARLREERVRANVRRPLGEHDEADRGGYSDQRLTEIQASSGDRTKAAQTSQPSEAKGIIDTFEDRFEDWPRWKKVLYSPYWIPLVAGAIIIECLVDNPHAESRKRQYERIQLQDQFYREHTRERPDVPSRSDDVGAQRIEGSLKPANQTSGTSNSARDEIMERAAQILAERSENNRL